jgi:hypothetical protein
MIVNQNVADLGRSEDRMLTFFLTQRTGSSALTAWLVEALGKDKVYDHRHVADFIRWRECPSEKLKGYKVYTGLEDNRVAKAPVPFTGFSVVRHPLFRIRSLYDMSRGNETHWSHEIATQNDLAGFYRSGKEVLTFYFQNLCCRRIATKPRYEEARKNIDRFFGAVGLTHHLNHFSSFLIATYGWNIEPMPGSVPDEEKYKFVWDDPAVEMILDDNREDLALYEDISKSALKRFAQSRPLGSPEPNSNVACQVYASE